MAQRPVPARTREHDRFGPWIDEVRTREDVPRLYRSHPLDLDAARLVLKVPRNIPRRDTTPDMDLYEHLLVVGDDGLTVLSRRPAPGRQARPGPDDGGFDVRTVAGRDLVGVHDVVSLLDGRLTLRTRDGAALTVRYNGSARDNIHRLVDTLHATAMTAPPSAVGHALLAAAPAGAGTPDVGQRDVSLISDFQEVAREHPDLRPWAWHGRRPAQPERTGVVGLALRVSHVVSPMTLHGAILAGDERSLQVFGRHDWLVRGNAPVHSASRLVVPLATLDRVEVAPHALYGGTTVLTLVAGEARIEMAVPTDSSAHRLLAGGRAT